MSPNLLCLLLLNPQTPGEFWNIQSHFVDLFDVLNIISIFDISHSIDPITKTNLGIIGKILTPAELTSKLSKANFGQS